MRFHFASFFLRINLLKEKRLKKIELASLAVGTKIFKSVKTGKVEQNYIYFWINEKTVDLFA